MENCLKFDLFTKTGDFLLLKGFSVCRFRQNDIFRDKFSYRMKLLIPNAKLDFVFMFLSRFEVLFFQAIGISTVWEGMRQKIYQSPTVPGSIPVKVTFLLNLFCSKMPE